MIEQFESFRGAIYRAYKCIQKLKSAEMGSFGLRGAHVMCMYSLTRHPEGMTAAELSAACGEDKAAVSRTVAELEEKQLLTLEGGSEKKRYRARIRLTAEGMRISEQMDAIILSLVRKGDEGLTEADVATFYRTLDRICDNLEDYVNKKAY
ncbi:MAG: MarR family transcriptional regulator [Firmicutes bacterium]|nr:MarR family transcriptional regulator [Bacillota bacterium]